MAQLLCGEVHYSEVTKRAMKRLIPGFWPLPLPKGEEILNPFKSAKYRLFYGALSCGEREDEDVLTGSWLSAYSFFRCVKDFGVYLF
jgi:hypothetical protein